MAFSKKILPALKPSFSIVIPVYNAEATLRETLASVASQSYQHFEVIAVNDGSTDSSLTILEAWKNEQPHIPVEVIIQANQGLGASRNIAITKAKNDWIALLDADDLWLPQKLERLANTIVHNPDYALIFHGFNTFGTKRNRTRTGYPITSIEDLLTKGNPIMPSAMAAKAEVLKESPFSIDKNIHGAEDLDLWLRLLKNGYRFFHLPETLTLYRQTGGMSTNLNDHLQKVQTVIDHYHQQAWFDKNTLDKALARKNWEAARFYHKRGNFSEAKKYYQLAQASSLKAKFLVTLNQLKVSA